MASLKAGEPRPCVNCGNVRGFVPITIIGSTGLPMVQTEMRIIQLPRQDAWAAWPSQKGRDGKYYPEKTRIVNERLRALIEKTALDTWDRCASECPYCDLTTLITLNSPDDFCSDKCRKDYEDHMTRH